MKLSSKKKANLMHIKRFLKHQKSIIELLNTMILFQSVIIQKTLDKLKKTETLLNGLDKTLILN
jgi:hypothetical protein